jgi:hypothetical protein
MVGHGSAFRYARREASFDEDSDMEPPLLVETDDRFTLDVSTLPGAGLGLFARVGLTQGDTLEVPGVLVPAGSVSDRCTHFADHHKFRLGDLLLIPVGFGGMVNHSQAGANLEKVVQGRRVVLRALRAIAAGEELFLCYSEEARRRVGLA